MRVGDATAEAPMRWRTIKTIIVLAWLYSLLPSLVGVVENGRTLVSTLSLSAPPSPIGSALATILSTVIIAIAALSVLGRRRPRVRRHIGAFAVLALPWLTVRVANVFAPVGLTTLLIIFVWTAKAYCSRLSGTVVGVAYLAAFRVENWLEARVRLLNLGQFGFVAWIPFMVVIFATNPGAAPQLPYPHAARRG